MLVSESEFEFVIATHPVLLEVVGIQRDVMLWPASVIENKPVFQIEIMVQAQYRLGILANSGKGVQIEFVNHKSILRIDEPAGVRNPGVFGFEQIRGPGLCPGGIRGLLVW